ncbi:MAG: hypothetical protein WCG62_04585 [Actinomycetes bacterium]
MPTKQPRHPQTWMELGVTNAGLRQTFRAITWALDWQTVRASLDNDPSVEEVAKWWNESLRTTYRNQAAFRDAFPTLETPAQIFTSPQAQEAIKAVALAVDERSALKKVRAIERATVLIGQLPAT